MTQLHNSISFFQEVAGEGNEWTEDSDTRALVDQCRVLLRNCKSLARAMKDQQRPTRRFAHPGLILAPPDRELSDEMAQLYFEYFESTHRILHAPTFWTEYEGYWEDPTTAPLSLRFKILLVIAMGSSLHDQGGNTDFRSSVWQWVYASQTWLSGPLEKDRVNVEAIAVHCLLLLTRQILGFGVDLIWASTGSLVNRAIQIGLHRDPKHLPKMSILQAEIRRRLWATILEIILQSCLDSEMHPRISLDEFDTEPPLNLSDDEMSESTMVLNAHPPEVFTSTSMQLLLIESTPIRLQILQSMHSITVDISYQQVLDIHTRMVAALHSCDSLSSINNPTMAFQRNMLDFMMRRFLLHLHAPFAFRAGTERSLYFSRKTSVDVAVAIISPEPDGHFNGLMKAGAGLFKAELRLASVITSLDLIAYTKAQQEDLSLRRDSEHRHYLKRTMSKFLSLAEERLRHGESNVKEHMFIATIMAEVEAIETGGPVHLSIAKGAKRSLESCYNILQSRHSSAFSTPVETINADVNLDFGLGDDDFDMWSFLQYTDFQ